MREANIVSFEELVKYAVTLGHSEEEARRYLDCVNPHTAGQFDIFLNKIPYFDNEQAKYIIRYFFQKHEITKVTVVN